MRLIYIKQYRKKESNKMMNKETIKEFLKPEWRKVLTFGFLFFVLPIFMPQPISAPSWGFPIPYYSSGLNVETVFSFPFFILDILICYFLACLVGFTYNKFKAKKQ